MASLISVGSIYSDADKSVPHIIAGSESSFGIRTIVRIHVYGEVQVCFFGCLNQIAYNFISIGTAAVFGADGNLVFLSLIHI